CRRHPSIQRPSSMRSWVTSATITLSIHSLHERLAPTLDRATLQGQDPQLQNSICPSYLVIPRELLRTVRYRGDGN
ncbi:unnamed protein product, partial [Ectocarpus sp. 4 AP-2014]